MKELQSLGYTENGIGGAVSSKVNYVDLDSENVIEIKDFDENNISRLRMIYRVKLRFKYGNAYEKTVEKII